ncbi:MAG: hypothetical protein IJS94_02575 [Clostridia bacterium]|nr:hypothetical protein [Clostridia bacterium]
MDKGKTSLIRKIILITAAVLISSGSFCLGVISKEAFESRSGGMPVYAPIILAAFPLAVSALSALLAPGQVKKNKIDPVETFNYFLREREKAGETEKKSLCELKLIRILSALQAVLLALDGAALAFCLGTAGYFSFQIPALWYSAYVTAVGIYRIPFLFAQALKTVLKRSCREMNIRSFIQ